MKKISLILLNTLPVLIMIGLIPLIQNDYLLTVIDLGVIIASLAIKKYKNDLMILVFGLFIMIVSEYIFISTGVETFNRNSLFGLMPLWLPFLWGYGFIAIKRSLKIIDAQD